VQITDRFLLAAGTSFSAGDTDGATRFSYTPTGTISSHTLTATEIPSHSHSLNSHTHGLNSHRHSLNSHNHGLNNHTHGLNNHTHGLNNHTHSIPDHSHTLWYG